MEELKFFISAKLEGMESKKRNTSYMKRGSKLRSKNRKKNYGIKNNIDAGLLRSRAQMSSLLRAGAGSHGAAGQVFVLERDGTDLL